MEHERTAEEAACGGAGEARRSIVLVLSSLGGGGAERVASRLAQRWTDSGHAVTVVTLAGSDEDVYALPRRVRRVALGVSRPSRNAVVGGYRAWARVVALRRALTELRPERIVAFNDTTNVVTLLATLGLSVRVLACERADPRHVPNRWPWRLLRVVLYRRAASVVVQTQSVGRWARRRWRRVRVVPNFVEAPAAAARPGATEGRKTLVAVGRLDPIKGFDLLLDAFARVAPTAPEWTLRILGDGPERAALETRVEQLGLRGRVSLPGRVDDPAPHLARAHAFVLSSRSEGFPNALLEAMACGLPVVAFDCESGPAEIITDGRDGLLVPVGDVAALAAALEELFVDPERRALLGRNARAVTVRFSPDRILPQWSELIE